MRQQILVMVQVLLMEARHSVSLSYTYTCTHIPLQENYDGVDRPAVLKHVLHKRLFFLLVRGSSQNISRNGMHSFFYLAKFVLDKRVPPLFFHFISNVKLRRNNTLLQLFNIGIRRKKVFLFSINSSPA